MTDYLKTFLINYIDNFFLLAMEEGFCLFSLYILISFLIDNFQILNYSFYFAINQNKTCFLFIEFHISKINFNKITNCLHLDNEKELKIYIVLC